MAPTPTLDTLAGLGNRSQVLTTPPTPPSTVTYAADVVNQYTAVGGVARTHDNNGNLKDDGTWVFSYDFENRLVQVRQSGTLTLIADYHYDALGRRVEKVLAAGTTTRYLLDGVEVVEEYDAVGTWQARYVYEDGIDHPRCMDRADIADVNGNQNTTEVLRFHYHRQAPGSVTEVTQPTGAPVEWVTYDVYGQATIRDQQGNVVAQSAIGNPYLYTGREFDGENGLYYYRARMYDAVTGRFLQRDPAGYVDGPNALAYAQSAPTRYTDALGLESGSVRRARQLAEKAQKKADEATAHAEEVRAQHSAEISKRRQEFDDLKKRLDELRARGPRTRCVNGRRLWREEIEDLEKQLRNAGVAVANTLAPVEEADAAARHAQEFANQLSHTYAELAAQERSDNSGVLGMARNAVRESALRQLPFLGTLFLAHDFGLPTPDAVGFNAQASVCVHVIGLHLHLDMANPANTGLYTINGPALIAGTPGASLTYYVAEGTAGEDWGEGPFFCVEGTAGTYAAGGFYSPDSHISGVEGGVATPGVSGGMSISEFPEDRSLSPKGWLLVGVVAAACVGLGALLLGGAVGDAGAATEAWFRALAAGDAAQLEAMRHPAWEYGDVDKRRLAESVRALRSHLGSFLRVEGCVTSQSTHRGGTQVRCSLRFAKGSANGAVVLQDSRVVQYSLSSTLLPRDWLPKPMDTEAWQAQGSRILKECCWGEVKDAYSHMGPLFQKDVSFQAFSGNLAAVREALVEGGKVEIISESWDRDTDSLRLIYDIDASPHKVEAELTFWIGMAFSSPTSLSFSAGPP